MAAGFVFDIKTDLSPEGVHQLSLDIFAKWVDFAIGRTSLGGKRLMYPTGRYASSLRYQQEGESTIAIYADESVAPEAAYIEYGHAAVDLKTKLQHGRAYRMHRPVGKTPGSSLRRVGSGPMSFSPKMWAVVRGREASGFASIGPNSPPDSWIIPPMPAYSPALILAEQVRAAARRR